MDSTDWYWLHVSRGTTACEICGMPQGRCNWQVHARANEHEHVWVNVGTSDESYACNICGIDESMAAQARAKDFVAKKKEAVAWERERLAEKNARDRKRWSCLQEYFVNG